MKILILVLSISFLTLYASENGPKVNWSAYVDSYISFDNDYVPQQNGFNPARQLTYINYRKNQLSLNTAQIMTDITWSDFRGNISIHLGDLHKTAYETPGTEAHYIQQANAGFKLGGNFWVDAGYFLTHIGGESLLPKDNWLTSHSLLTYFEPFYQAGIRFSYESDNFTGQLHILNGNGIFDENNYNKSLGLFIGYKIADNLFASYAGIIGNEEPGSPNNAKNHILHNVVLNYDATEMLSIKGQIDLASKEKSLNVTEAGNFLGISITGHYKFSNSFSGTARFAYVDNSDGIYAPLIEGLEVTLGAEYKPTEFSYIRFEAGALQLSDKDIYKIFTDKDGKPSANRLSAAINFGLILK